MAEIIVRNRQTELRIDLTTVRANWDADAKVWANVMRNRSRWVNTPEALHEVYRVSVEQVGVWGLDVARLRTMRGAEIVEIQLPLEHPAISAIRAIPWEFVLSAAITGEPGLAEAPLILRHMPRPPAAAPSPMPTRALFIQSAPGKIADQYQFDSEYRLVREALSGWTVTQIKDPDLAELKQKSTQHTPAFVHITGADLHQGAQILGNAPPLPGSAGMYLKALSGEAVAYTDREIAAALAAPDRAPLCVSVNMYYSSEIAASLVAAGVDSAIGFLAEFDDATAEVFFSGFYRAVAAAPQDKPMVAFRRALESLLADPSTAKHLEGAPIVIWTATSVLDDADAVAEEEVENPVSTEEPLSAAQLRGLLSPYVGFPKEINYCGIHNGRSIFAGPAKLGIRNPKLRKIQGVCVDVTLTVAGEHSTFSRTLDIGRTNHPVDGVSLSLTSEMVRALRERMQANITVEFSYDGRPLLRETQQVGLLATDEWDNQSPWLPSFVLPRDPAVVDIVRWAQPFLHAIADASDAGFDNYLRLTGLADRQEEERSIVDHQVRALWWAVRQKCHLSYLAAAPVYTANAQRIRTPSAVLKGRAGTCLDLALLFTACLAAVDLRAVVFVLKDHALPGYLRSPAGHSELAALMSSYFPGVSGREEATAPRTAWILGPDGFEYVLQMIRSGELVPLETVALTERGGFAEAIQRGIERLNRGGEQGFGGLYDLTLARRNGVTPLPIAGLI